MVLIERVYIWLGATMIVVGVVGMLAAIPCSIFLPDVPFLGDGYAMILEFGLLACFGMIIKIYSER